MTPSVPSEETLSKFARSVLTRNLRVRPGERVTIEAWPHTLPWAVALARESRRLGAFPLVLHEDETAYWDTVANGGARILGTVGDHEWATLSKTDVYIHMWGPGDRVRLASLPPAQGRRLTAFNDEWYDRARKAGVRGARLEIGRPYPSLAEAYRVDIRTWADQVVAATLVPPHELERRAGPVMRALARGRTLRITHSNGTDLTLGLARRAPIAQFGRPRVGDRKQPLSFLCNLPAGAVLVALDESVASGTIVGNRTCYYEDGVATGPILEFREGRLVGARFGSGGERFDGPFRTAGAGRDRPGRFSLGLNPKLRDTPQLEDVEADAVTVSVGGNQYLGGKNRSRFFGWAVTAGATVAVDGRPIAPLA